MNSEKIADKGGSDGNCVVFQLGTVKSVGVGTGTLWCQALKHSCFSGRKSCPIIGTNTDEIRSSKCLMNGGF